MLKRCLTNVVKGLIVCGATTLALPLGGQVAPTGTISGVVHDPGGLMIPRVKVTVTNVDTAHSTSALTGSDGSYRFPALPVGSYTVKAEATGFKTKSETNVSLDVTQEDVVNFGMEVGAVEEQVVVQADDQRIDTTSSSIGHTVDTTQIEQLPLNGRNFVDLTLLQTGVTQFQNNNFGTNALFGEFYSANGAPIRSNLYTLDGAILGNIQGATASSISGLSLGLDGIDEYRVMTNSYGAEYGLVMGSQTVIVTKSGTSHFHGSVFEYFRNSVLNARNYFDYLYQLPASVPGGGRRVAPFERNQFGASVGGPIVKDKTFFFATYEGFREVFSNPPNVGVTPTIPAACHTPVVNGVQTVTSACDPSAKGGSETVNSTIVPLLALWPLPNVQPGNQFTYLSTERTHEDYLQGRIDHTFNQKDSMFGRYTYDNTNETYPKIFQYFDNGLVERQQYATVSENHIFSSALLNAGRFSFSRSRVLDQTPSASNPFTKQLTGQQYSCISGQTICPLPISSIANFSGASTALIEDVQEIFSLGDDVFLTKGKHALKFGALFNHFDQYANQGSGQKGSVAFSNLHNFLLGNYRSYTTYGPSYNSLKDMLFATVGFYASDEYRVMPRLTLNLGLRYEFNTQPNEKNGRQSYFLSPPYSDTYSLGPMLNDPTYKDFSPRVGFALDVFGTGKTSLRGGAAILYDIANLGEIFSLAGLGMPPYAPSYTITPTTPIDANGDRVPKLVLPLPVPATTSGLQGTSPTTIDRNYRSPRMIDFNLAVEQQLPSNIILSVAYAGSRGTHLWQPVSEANPRCPTSFRYVPQGCAAITTGKSQLPIWGNASAPRLNPFFNNFSLFRAQGVSWYHSGQVNLTEKARHGLEFQVAYTFSKLLDDTEGIANSDSSGSTTGQVEDPFDPILDWGPANFDVRHNLHINGVYHLPKFRAEQVADKFVNGWWFSSIVNVESGTPFSPLLSSDRQQSGLAGTNGGLERPSLVTSTNIALVTAQAQAAGVTTCPPNATGCIPYNPTVYNPKTVITHSVQQWFDPNMFTLQPVGTIGDVGRNTLREPGLESWDLAVNKDTHLALLGDQGQIEFRAETFNILNHPNFGPSVNGGFLTGGVGDVQEQPTFTGLISTATAGRQIQFALRVQF